MTNSIKHFRNKTTVHFRIHCNLIIGSAFYVTIIMESVIRAENVDEAVYISLCANAHGTCINLSGLSSNYR